MQNPEIPFRLPARLDQIAAPVEALVTSALEYAKEAARRRNGLRRPRVGSTLRPGPDTPLWNALADEVEPLVRVFGEQAKLGRKLNLPRQRIHQFFIARSQMPDAERVLELLLWLVRQRPRPAPADRPPRVRPRPGVSRNQ